MTRDDLVFLVQTKTNKDFNYKNDVYRLSFGTDEKGEYIKFGLLYEERKYYSFGEFWNEAKIENHFFKEMLDIF